MRRHPVQISFSFLLHVTLTHLGAHIVGSPKTSPRIASVLVSDGVADAYLATEPGGAADALSDSDACPDCESDGASDADNIYYDFSQSEDSVLAPPRECSALTWVL